MARPARSDRSTVAYVILTVRLKPPDKALLDRLVAERSEELTKEGLATVTTTDVVRWLIRKEAAVRKVTPPVEGIAKPAKKRRG